MYMLSVSIHRVSLSRAYLSSRKECLSRYPLLITYLFPFFSLSFLSYSYSLILELAFFSSLFCFLSGSKDRIGEDRRTGQERIGGKLLGILVEWAESTKRRSQRSQAIASHLASDAHRGLAGGDGRRQGTTVCVWERASSQRSPA